jgi:hypothetical protein
LPVARDYAKSKDKRFSESDRAFPVTKSNKRRVEELRRTFPN